MVSGAAAPSPATPMGPIRQFCFTHPARFEGHGGPAKVLQAAREAHRIVFGKQKTIDHRNHIFPNTFLATLLFGKTKYRATYAFEVTRLAKISWIDQKATPNFCL